MRAEGVNAGGRGSPVRHCLDNMGRIIVSSTTTKQNITQNIIRVVDAILITIYERNRT
jgi:hypothetical protein